jgi:hypothetical protein
MRVAAAAETAGERFVTVHALGRGVAGSFFCTASTRPRPPSAGAIVMAQEDGKVYLHSST